MHINAWPEVVDWLTSKRMWPFTWHQALMSCHFLCVCLSNFRSSPPEGFLGKVFLKVYSKFTEKHPCWSLVLIIKLQIELGHECSPINLLHIFWITFPKNSSEGLLLKYKILYVHLLWRKKVVLFCRKLLKSSLRFKGTIIQVWKSPYMFAFIWKWYPENFIF